MSKSSLWAHIYKSVLILMVGLPFLASAQSEVVTAADSTSRGKYALVAYLGGGVTRFVGAAGSPPGYHTVMNRNGGSGTFRLMWHPDHRLDFGIETGWTSFYSYKVQGGLNDASVNLTGIPMLLVFSMPISQRLRVFAGTGGYLLTSNLDYVGNVQSKTFSIGYMASAMYIIPISEKVNLAAEFKWFNARETKDQTLSLQLMAVWRLFQW